MKKGLLALSVLALYSVALIFLVDRDNKKKEIKIAEPSWKLMLPLKSPDSAGYVLTSMPDGYIPMTYVIHDTIYIDTCKGYWKFEGGGNNAGTNFIGTTDATNLKISTRKSKHHRNKKVMYGTAGIKVER